MEWIFEADRPIYMQLEEQIKLRIVSGEYSAGEKMPAVRDLAAEAAVNPNTLQRALTELERQGLLFTQRTSGRYVTEDENVILDVKRGLAMEHVKSFLEKMAAIGFDKEAVIKLIDQNTATEGEEVNGNS